jgi:hypothetical protein
MPANTVKVDRSTIWGNPFVVGEAPWGREPFTRETAVATYREWIVTNSDLERLRGKNLACWCKPGAPCHADVLLELANS